MPNHCQAKTKNGKSCRAFSQSNSDFCFTHDPRRAAERKRARLIGGFNHQALRRRPFPRCDLNSASGLRDFVGEVIQDTWRLGSSIGRARVLCQLTQLQNAILLDWVFHDTEDEDEDDNEPSATEAMIEQ